MPTRDASQSMSSNLSRPEDIALASPVSTESSLANTGSGYIHNSVVLDPSVDYFQEAEGDLSPPLLVRFTSGTLYDVLDNTDPANPIPLQPPLKNLTFVPGMSNSILPEDSGQTQIESYGGVTPLTIVRQEPDPAPTLSIDNGFSPLRMTATTIIEETGQTFSQPQLYIPENSSAREIANSLSDLEGVTATASTTVHLTNFTHGDDGFIPLTVFINGVNLSEQLSDNQLDYDPSYPEEVPEPISPDFLADRINAHFGLQDLGISAKSDGSSLTVESIYGDDIEVALWGDTNDGVDISNGSDISLSAAGTNVIGELTPYSGFDFSDNGPYVFGFVLSDGSEHSIELTEEYETSEQVIQGIQSLIEDELTTTANINVSLSEDGQISFSISNNIKWNQPFSDK